MMPPSVPTGQQLWHISLRASLLLGIACLLQTLFIMIIATNGVIVGFVLLWGIAALITGILYGLMMSVPCLWIQRMYIQQCIKHLRITASSKPSIRILLFLSSLGLSFGILLILCTYVQVPFLWGLIGSLLMRLTPLIVSSLLWFALIHWYTLFTLPTKQTHLVHRLGGLCFIGIATIIVYLLPFP